MFQRIGNNNAPSMATENRSTPGRAKTANFKTPFPNFSHLSGPTITITVGDPTKDEDQEKPVEHETIHVHESLICVDSEFFKAATSSLWRSSSSSTPIDLRDEQPNIFKIYLHFLYTKNVVFQSKYTDIYDDYGTLAYAYVFGEKIISRNFCNAVVKAMIDLQEKSRKYPPKKAIKIVYDGTTPSSPIRKLFVEYWAQVSHRNWTTQNLIETTHPDFVEDLVSALIGARPVPATYAPCPQEATKYYIKERDEKTLEPEK